MSKRAEFPNIERLDGRTCISGKIRRCGRMVSEIFRVRLLPFNITSSQLSILFIVAKMDNVTQNLLSEWLVLEKSTVSRNMKRLLDRKLIQKESGKTFSMTHDGKVLLEEIVPEWEEAMKEVRQKIKGEGEEALNLLITRLLN